jgi:urea carboxylase
MVKVIKKGLETSVQDYPGRIGTLNLGFPPSGPMDSWSFRLANVLVGNEPGTAALECQFMGPTLKFNSDRVIAITGADMSPKIDDAPVPLWESLDLHPRPYPVELRTLVSSLNSTEATDPHISGLQ